jgi:hypothetical protein
LAFSTTIQPLTLGETVSDGAVLDYFSREKGERRKLSQACPAPAVAAFDFQLMVNAKSRIFPGLATTPAVFFSATSVSGILWRKRL